MRPARVLSLIVIGLALTAAGAVARPVHALSNREYQQLRLAQQRIRSLEAADARSLRRAAAVCDRMRDVSELVTAVRRGCVDLIRLAGDDARLNARATRCGIDPSSAAAILACLVPAVKRYHRDAEAFYRAESRVDRLARARGFGRRCVAVIGDSPRNIAAEGRLADALGAAVRALERQSPQALQTLSGKIEAAVKAVRPGPSSLSLCPHH